jgi:hypothetical protein
MAGEGDGIGHSQAREAFVGWGDRGATFFRPLDEID